MSKPIVVPSAPGRGYASPALSTLVDRATLDQASCPACYRPIERRNTYCAKCRESGAAKRHLENRRAEYSAPRVAVRYERVPHRPRMWRKVTEEVIRGALQEFMYVNGRVPSSTEWKEKSLRPAQSSIYRVYGSWEAALADAQLDRRAS